MQQLFCFLPLCFPDDVPAAPLPLPAASPPLFLGSVFFFRFNRLPSSIFHLPSFPSMIRLPSVFPSFPFFHIPQSLLIIIGYFFFFYK